MIKTWALNYYHNQLEKNMRFTNGDMLVQSLKNDFPNEWNDIINVLESFRLNKSDIVKAGGRKSPVSNKIDNFLYSLDWVEKSFDTKVLIDEQKHTTPTHKIDCLKNRIALEIEWNNKDPFLIGT